MAKRPLTPVKNHPGIYKRKGRYIVIYRDHLGRQKKQFSATLAQARDIKAATRTADIRRGEYAALSKTTLNEYAPRWVETYTGRTGRGLGEGTRASYNKALEKHILPFLGRLQLPQIEPMHIRSLRGTSL